MRLGVADLAGKRPYANKYGKDDSMAGVPLPAGHGWSTREEPGKNELPIISYTVFIAVIWTGFSLAVVFLSCRLLARFMGPRRLFWDDGFAIFALALVTTMTGLWQWAARDMFYMFDVQAGLDTYQPDFLDRVHRWLLVALVAEVTFYTSLLSIKLALLMFFRRLGNNVSYFNRLWWPVLLFTLAAYLVNVSVVDYRCLTGPDSGVRGYCTGPRAIHYETMVLQMNGALDVLTDFLIMLLPIILLRNVHIRTCKKLAFCGLFSLSVVTMTIAVVRVINLNTRRLASGEIDPAYLYMWNVLEACVAIVVACLSAFPQLFAQSGPRHKKPAPYLRPTDTRLRLMSRICASHHKNSRGPSGDDTLLGLETMDDNLAYMPDREPVSQTKPGLTSTQNPVLVPGSQPPAVAQVCSTRGNSQGLLHGLHFFAGGPRDRITQSLEYCVERDPPSQ